MRFLNIVAGLLVPLVGCHSIAIGQSSAESGRSGESGSSADVRTDVRTNVRSDVRGNVRPLAPLLGKRVLVVPTQRLAFHDSLGWAEQAGAVNEVLTSVDHELGFMFEERGIGCLGGNTARETDTAAKSCGSTRWIPAHEIVESARRNGVLGVDPRTLAVDPLREGKKLDKEQLKWQLRDPLAAQIRSLIALNDTRYVIVPVELRLVNAKATGEVEPRLRIVIIDGRRVQVQWMGDVVGQPRAAWSPAVAADLASRFGELIAR